MNENQEVDAVESFELLAEIAFEDYAIADVVAVFVLEIHESFNERLFEYAFG